GVRHVHKRPDPFFVSLRRKQHHARFRFRNAQLDPALLLIERLIGDDREPKFLGVKIQRAILVGYWNTDEFDLLDHDALNLIGPISSRPEFIAIAREKVLSV